MNVYNETCELYFARVGTVGYAAFTARVVHLWTCVRLYFCVRRSAGATRAVYPLSRGCEYVRVRRSACTNRVVYFPCRSLCAYACTVLDVCHHSGIPVMCSLCGVPVARK